MARATSSASRRSLAPLAVAAALAAAAAAAVAVAVVHPAAAQLNPGSTHGACGVVAQARATPWSTWAPANGVSGAAPGEAVTIPAGAFVYLDATPAQPLGDVVVRGALALAPDVPGLTLSAARIEVAAGGRLVAGGYGCPVTAAGVVLELTGAPQRGSGAGSKGVFVESGGQLDLHGLPLADGAAWTRLGAHANAGATSLTLSAGVATGAAASGGNVLDGRGWAVGDVLVLASTDYEYVTQENETAPVPPQHEVVTITALTSATEVAITPALRFNHYGEVYRPTGAPSDGSHDIDMRAEVGLLSRNLHVRGDTDSDATEWGAHLLCHRGGEMRVSGVELYRVGQHREAGRYPIHYHVAEDQNNSYVSQNSIHDSYQRAVTLHGARRLMVRDNVAYNVQGHMYFIEDGDEMENVLYRNLGIYAKVARTLLADTEPSIFWITSPLNHFYDNAAVGASFGYWYSLPSQPTGFGRGELIFPDFGVAGDFDGNSAHGCGSGLFVDRGQQDDAGRTDVLTEYRPRALEISFAAMEAVGHNRAAVFAGLTGPGGQGLGTFGAITPAVFSNFVAYKNTNFGLWGRGDSLHTYNARLSDNQIGSSWPTRLHLFHNSVVVGESDNVGMPDLCDSLPPGECFRYWPTEGSRSRPSKFWMNRPLLGYQQYDAGGGDMILNTAFYDFVDEHLQDPSPPVIVPAPVFSPWGVPYDKWRRAGAIGAQTGPNVLQPLNRFMGLTFTRVDHTVHYYETIFTVNGSLFVDAPVYLRDDAMMGITTVDAVGDLTGDCGAHIVGASAPHLHHAACAAEVPGSGAVVCPSNTAPVVAWDFGTSYNAPTVHGVRPDINNENRLNLYRLADGVRVTNEVRNVQEYNLGPTPYAEVALQYNQNLLSGTDYMVVLGEHGSANKSLPAFGVDIQLGAPASSGAHVRLAFPYPPGTTFVVNDASREIALTAAPSLAALDMDTYYWDNTAGVLWLQPTVVQRLDATSYRAYHVRASMQRIGVTATCPGSDCTHYVDPASLAAAAGPIARGPTANLCDSQLGSYTEAPTFTAGGGADTQVYAGGFINNFTPLAIPSQNIAFPCTEQTGVPGATGSVLDCTMNALCSPGNLLACPETTSFALILSGIGPIQVFGAGTTVTHMTFDLRVEPGYGDLNLVAAMFFTDGDDRLAPITVAANNFNGPVPDDGAWHTYHVPVTDFDLSAARNSTTGFAFAHIEARPVRFQVDNIMFGDFTVALNPVPGYPNIAAPTLVGPGRPADLQPSPTTGVPTFTTGAASSTTAAATTTGSSSSSNPPSTPSPSAPTTTVSAVDRLAMSYGIVATTAVALALMM